MYSISAEQYKKKAGFDYRNHAINYAITNNIILPRGKPSESIREKNKRINTFLENIKKHKNPPKKQAVVKIVKFSDDLPVVRKPSVAKISDNLADVRDKNIREIVRSVFKEKPVKTIEDILTSKPVVPPRPVVKPVVKPVVPPKPDYLKYSSIINNLKDDENYKINFNNNDEAIIITKNILKDLKFNHHKDFFIFSFLIGSKTHHYTVTRDNRYDIVDKLNENSVEITTTVTRGITPSDAIFNEIINGVSIKELIITRKDGSVKTRLSGKLFYYKHLFDSEHLKSILLKLQIFHKDDNIDYTDNCFIYSLKGQLSENKINSLKMAIKTKSVSLSLLKNICKEFDIYIEVNKLKYLKSYEVIKTKYGNPKSKEKAFICLYEDHYFTYIKDTGVTKFSLENYDILKNKSDWYNFIKKDERTKTNYINSLKLVYLIMKNKNNFLVDISDEELIRNPTYNENKILNLNIDDNLKPMWKKKTKNIAYDDIIYADCETYFSNNVHIPYTFCCTFENNDEVLDYDNCKDFLESLCNRYGKNKVGNLIIYFHNSTYDASFILPYLFNLQILEKDNNYVSVSGYYSIKKGKERRTIKILIKDSLRLIPMKLSKFPETFDMKDIQKEVMYYSMFNDSTIKNINNLSKSVMEKYIQEFNKKSLDKKIKLKLMELEFWKNMEKWNCLNNDGTYNLKKYAVEYCKQDCRVLKFGVQSFAKTLEKLELKLHKYFSLPSMTTDYFKMKGCYDDCYYMRGCLSSFFINFVNGGRVMSANNQKQYVNAIVQDFDAVSLYPSAMRLFEGFLKGKPKLITKEKLNYEFLEKQSGYFIKVKILKVGIKRRFPTMCLIDNGIKKWTNDVENHYLYLDKYSLEEAIKAHDIKYEIIEGYYFDEGFNTKIKDEIKVLFDERIKAKDAKNECLQQTYKLMMNSSYGKLIQKSNPIEIKIIKKKDLDSFILNNYNNIKSYNDIYNSNYVRVQLFKCLNESLSAPHLGCQILSYSKRLMNNVINTAEDNNIDIYYQDTDSMHLKEQDIKKLAEAYKIKYNSDLIGKQMGQFHSDFELKVNGEECKNVFSEKLIVLGKKCYLDLLVGNDSKGNVVRGYHVRMKGVSLDSINDLCEKTKMSIEQVYESLYSGNELTFNLSVNNKASFKKDKSQQYSNNIIELKRKIKF